MQYIDNTLSHGETIEKKYHHHWMVNAIVCFHAILGVVTLGIWMPVAIYRGIDLCTMEQGLTSKRVVRRFGVFSKHTEEMNLSAIETIYLEQSLFGRMFDYGTVIITGIGIGSVSLKYIPNPYQVRKEIENIKTHPREVTTEQSA